MSCGHRDGRSCGCSRDRASGGGGRHDERRAPRAPHNPPGRTALDHRVGEYGSFLAAMLDRLASPAYPALRRLTVRTPDDPAIALLDAWAVLGDLLTFHSERIADEGYLRTADDHRSLVRLGRLVGYRPRPGIAADTHLAYTVDRDPRSREDVPVLIPRGSRSHSVPASSREEAQTFETTEDLTARWSWNDLRVRRRRPAPLTPEDLRERSELYVAGTANALSAGDRLLFVFGGGSGGPADAEGAGGSTGSGQRLLLPVTRIRIDRDDDSTALGLPVSPPPTLAELVGELRRWITPAADSPNPRPVGSVPVEEFDEQVLSRLRADLDLLDTPEAFTRRLEEPVERLEEARALAEPHEESAAWFERLAAVLVDLREKAAELEPLRPDGARYRLAAGSTGWGAGGDTGGDAEPGDAAARALGALLPALRSPGTEGVRRPTAAGAVPADPARLFGPGPDLGARLAAALDPSLSGRLYEAWRRSAPAEPPAPATLTDLLAMRVTAAPFGSTAPLKPVQDERGRVIRQSDWPLTGNTLTTVRVVFDTTGKVPVRAEFVHAETTASVQRTENLPADVRFAFGPGEVRLATRTGQDNDPSWLRRRPVDSREPGVTAELSGGLPELTLFVSRPGADARVQVAIRNGEPPLQWHLAPDRAERATYGGHELTVAYRTGGGPAGVEIGIATVPEAVHRNVLALDTVHEKITAGSWVAIERPRKGAPDGIPGDSGLSLVTTRVTAVRTGSYARYGITGRGTELTLADPWLDEHDVLLSHVRDATVHAAGEPLRPADEPLGDDVGGNEIELAELYDGLRPGRTLILSGERTDIPGTTGVRGTELAVIAAVEQRVDPELPGDHVHTVLTLTADLAHRYRRETLAIHGNVVPATHGETRDEALGSGDAGRAGQTFALWNAPLTWLPADNASPTSGRGYPHGARPALEVRVDGLLWHPVDSLAGRGPLERVYVIGTDADGRTTVTFGDGVNGARLPTGHENVRARYRFGTGGAANVAAGRITQAVSRPLGVTAVTNPLPATGGAEADGPESARRGIPLAVSALDRLVSVRDYEDFTRCRAGIGRASAREVFDGRRQVLHVTVAGAGDAPIGADADTLHALRASLHAHGDARLPVRVDVRELVLLLLAARVTVEPDHSWAAVEPRLRQALLGAMGFEGRELGQPARLSEVLATAHSVPGVDHVDVDVFSGVSASALPAGPLLPGGGPHRPRTVVPARPARYDEQVHTVTAEGGETLGSIAARHGITLPELLRLNPDIIDTRPLPRGRSVYVFRGVRPAQLAMFSPAVAADTLILTEAPR
ncbi:putative baseplate assembly protein [Streptomyces radiopugnans]|uniref:Putative baseplate assembly protein n=1 Tax=Streptomyces radiopugnans TaxID=403935 RepID=A0A1H9FNM2_9ACTN|nr:putative baseplate assembly protein [Streptomyces radiopugnans]SEQ39561.1 putative baseplate assembly protein [Streptomyces radiopugnans]